jgi:hypothetical protein
MANFRKRNGKWRGQIRNDGHTLTKIFQLREDARPWARKHLRLIDLGGLLPPALEGTATNERWANH